MASEDDFRAAWTVLVVVLAFVALLRDLIQSDWVMMLSVCALNLAGVLTITEALAGFANEGLLTVAALFVVAAGISATGGLDWYMGKLLGKPRTTAGAQLRLMIPVACVSGFLNNTPVVAVMIPIVLRWCESTGMAKEQLMIPLSFASVLGGTCTLIGTSTNLVVQGMVQTWSREHAGSESVNIGLFDLGLYACRWRWRVWRTCCSRRVFVAKSARRIGGATKADQGEDEEDLLVGARRGWSSAVGHTVAASGLRGLPGLYLVSVRRNEALLRAVGPEFILNQGDILYFTGMVESLGKVCAEYGLMAITQEHDDEEEGEFDDSAEQSETLNDLAVHSSSSIADLQKLARTHAIYKETESGIYALKKRRRRPRPRHSQGSQHDSSDAGAGAHAHRGIHPPGNATLRRCERFRRWIIALDQAQALRIYGDNLKTRWTTR